MIISEQSNFKNSLFDFADQIINESVYLDDDCEYNNPSMIPIVEDSIMYEGETYPIGLVSYEDISKLSENYSIDLVDSLSLIAESNQIEYGNLAVVVESYSIFEEPENIDYLRENANIFVNEIQDSSLAYQFCESCVDEYARTADDLYLDLILDEAGNVKYVTNADVPDNPNTADLIDKRLNVKPTFYKGRGMADDPRVGKNKKEGVIGHIVGELKRGNPFATGRDVYRNLKDHSSHQAKWFGLFNKTRALAGGVKAGARAAATNKYYRNGAIGLAGVAAASYGIKKVLQNKDEILKQANRKPKSWIAKKIASLRKLYSKWLAKANKETNSNKANAIKKVAAKILNLIDALMKKLETTTA